MGDTACEDRPGDLPSSSTPSYTQTNDAAVSQLLAKLDEGMHTVANLRSILTMKTAELQELLAQLEMTSQVITQVESTTTHIESLLKDLGLDSNSTHARDLLINAQASLDSAIKSANHLYSDQRRRPASVSSGKSDPHLIKPSVRTMSRIRYRPDTKHLLRQINEQLRDLQVDAGMFFSSIGSMNDIQVLQQAYVNLDLAKTVALSAKSNLKRRKIMLTSARKRNGADQVKLLGEKIREGVDLWRQYTRDAPLLINGDDILVHLELQDGLLDRHTPTGYRLSLDMKSRGNSPTQSSSSSTSNPGRQSWRQSASLARETAKEHRRRSSSISSTSSIPLPSSAIATSLSSHRYSQPSPPPPVPPLPAAHAANAATPTKRQSLHPPRHASTTRVKATVGVSRVRTSSLTNRTRESFQNAAQSANADASQQSSLPPPPSAATANATTDDTDLTLPVSSNVSKLKSPTQRGPGSTLRIRSMLAKRQHHPRPSEATNA
ncbi:hypothetical protein BC940DRAFT_306559 [Gongronella butleri]|nr:hypothetical protein BC940DRAFT_306559 [Gongronella butleri]